MDNRAFAEELYEFLKTNDINGYYTESSPEDCIADLESYLSDVQLVKETIKDIEEIADEFDDHEVYVSEVKPLLESLREIKEELEAKANIRMVGETAYEVKHAIHVGDKEIVFAEDEKAGDGMCWLVGNYTQNDLFGQYAECQVSDDFIEAMQEFTDRVNTQLETMKSEINQSKTPQIFTAEHCYPHNYSEKIEGKVVAVKAKTFRPEYRRGDIQLIYVTGGNGAMPNPIGTKVYHKRLSDGKESYVRRSDILGEVKPECMPDWAVRKLAELQSEKNTAQPKKDKGDAR